MSVFVGRDAGEECGAQEGERQLGKHGDGRVGLVTRTGQYDSLESTGL